MPPGYTPPNFQKDFHHSDHVLNDFLDRQSAGLGLMTGYRIGPFDVPDDLGGPDEPFTLRHELGEVPAFIVIEDLGTTGGGIYATDADRAKWTKNTVVVRSKDAQNKMISIRVVKAGG